MRRYGAMALAALLCTAAVPAFAAWDRVGSVEFSMRDSHDSTPVNFRGDSVALTARDSDVFCRDIEASFDNGRTRTILHDATIPFGQTLNVDLPGGTRDVNRLDFDCRPMGNWRARVDVAANMMYGPRLGYGYGRDNYGNGRENPVQRFLGHVFGD